MFSSLRHRGVLVMAAALALAAGAAPVLASQPALVSAAPHPAKASKRGLFGGARVSIGLYGRKSAGMTAAQQKRAAVKKRGIVRNRRHHR